MKAKRIHVFPEFLHTPCLNIKRNIKQSGVTATSLKKADWEAGQVELKVVK